MRCISERNKVGNTLLYEATVLKYICNTKRILRLDWTCRIPISVSGTGSPFRDSSGWCNFLPFSQATKVSQQLQTFSHQNHLLRRSGRLDGFLSRKLRQGHLVRAHSNVCQGELFEELAFFSSSAAGFLCLFFQNTALCKTTKCEEAEMDILCQLGQVVVVQITFLSALSLWDFYERRHQLFLLA